jgi:imidazolonepropionase-like amidohydrolase
MLHEADLHRRLADTVEAATGDAWRLEQAWSAQGCLCLQIASGNSPGASLALTLEISAARLGRPAYARTRDFGFSYRHEARSLPPAHAAYLDRVVAAVATLLRVAGFDPSADELLPRTTLAPFPTPYHRAHLESHAALPADAVEAFRRDGHVLVRGALRRDVVLAARPHVLAALHRGWPANLPPVEQRRDAYSRSFTQLTDLGAGDPIVRAFARSPRIARMAAELMGASGVRCFCEDWLVKEPGAGITPWHQDEAVFPFDADATITCWVPLQDVRPGDGLLRFARGSHRLGLAPIEDIGDTSEAEFARIIAEHSLSLDELPAVLLGDVSFHHGRTFHGAFANLGKEWRVVLALHCFADGARLKRPTTPKMAKILAGSAPAGSPGEPAVAPCWPLLWGPSSAPAPRRRSRERAFHLSATPLPWSTRPIDLWIEDGRVTFEPVDGAEPLAAPGGFLVPGLVDCHSHISYPHDPADPVSSPRWMNALRAEHAATGVLVLRDMGAVDDAVSSLLDVPGLPRVHAAGAMILRRDDFPFTRTDPSELLRACVARVERGARWVKIFADFADDFRGRTNSGFSEVDEVTYAPELLAEAVSAVHALGGRVAAHAFTRAGAEAAIGAAVDSLEHGWGVDESLLGEMGRRGVAWVPLVGIAPGMWRTAVREGQRERAAWVERTMERLAGLLPRAEERGVRVFAGTDRFPEVTLGDEIAQLHELGMSRVDALAAGSWGARAWLDEPGIEEGAPADFVLFRADPRADLAVVLQPELIVAGGERVAPSLARVRPRHTSWREQEREEAARAT